MQGALKMRTKAFRSYKKEFKYNKEESGAGNAVRRSTAHRSRFFFYFIDAGVTSLQSARTKEFSLCVRYAPGQLSLAQEWQPQSGVPKPKIGERGVQQIQEGRYTERRLSEHMTKQLELEGQEIHQCTQRSAFRRSSSVFGQSSSLVLFCSSIGGTRCTINKIDL